MCTNYCNMKTVHVLTALYAFHALLTVNSDSPLNSSDRLVLAINTDAVVCDV